MLILRRPETAQGRTGFWESGNSQQTLTADEDIAHTVRAIRGQNYHSAVFELIDQFAEVEADAEGEPVDPRSFAHARDLLDALPSGFVVPEVATDPDGEVAFDWIREDRTMVSVSVGPTGRISYAACLRDGTAHGLLLRGEGFPAALTALLRRLYHPA